MRITNKMMSNNSMANINSNKTYLDRLNTQMATEKKITRPSDDPIVAIRALRLRSNLSEVTQYYGANVPDAQSWVSVTQTAIDSTMGMLSTMRSLCDQAANGTNTTSEREKIYQTLEAYKSQIYSNGNVTNAGRSVFTGYRTGEKLTFTADTEADYRGINDRFNASDVVKAVYVESPVTMDSINPLTENNETQIREDRVNRIRLSYDNINGSVRTGPIAGWDGDEAGTISNWDSGATYDKYFNEDGTLNDTGRSTSYDVTIEGETVNLKFHEPYDQTFVFEPEYTKKDMSSKTTVSGDSDEIKVKYGDFTYTIKKDPSGAYSADKGAIVQAEGGNLKLTIPGPNGTKDIYTEITVKADGSGVEDSNKYSRMSEIGYWFDYDYAGSKDALSGKAYATLAKDTTRLVYRTALTGNPSVPQNSITTDATDGIQSFDLEFGGKTLKIQKYPEENRWFALEGGTVSKMIEVTQNTDKSFTVSVGTDTGVGSHSNSKNFQVFNISANARNVTSYYAEHELEVKITDSTSSVAVDSDGNELTAYQYLALNDNDKNPDSEAANSIYLLADTGELVFGSDVADTLSGLKDIPGVDTISVIYDKSKFEEGDLRPEHYFDAQELDDKHNIFNRIVYDSYDQAMYYTVGTNQNIQINTNAGDVFDPQIVRELDDILRAIEDYNAAEEKVNKLSKLAEQDGSTKVKDLLAAAQKELSLSKEVLQRRYENGITAFGGFYDKCNLANTNCGTIDSRLTLISNRLAEEKSTVTTLASENENVDITNIAVEVKEAELVYNAALMATGKINQRSLIDYI